MVPEQSRVRTAMMLLGIPFLLLLLAGVARFLTTESLLGYPVRDLPALYRRSAQWGTAAAVTLLICAILLAAVRVFALLPRLPRSRWDAVIAGLAILAPRVALFLVPVFTAEFIAACYLAENIFFGAPTYFALGMMLPVLVSTTIFLLAFWRAGEADRPPVRINGLLIHRPAQPALFQALEEVTGHFPDDTLAVGATLASPAALIQGRTQLGSDICHGNLLLLPLPLCRLLSVSEFRALASVLCVPLRWPPVALRMQDAALRARGLARRIAATTHDAAFARFSPGVLPGLALALELAGLRPDSAAWAVAPDPEIDRLTAARFGSLDLARAILKTALYEVLWPPFEIEAARKWKRGPDSSSLIEPFREYLTPERITEALAALAGDLQPQRPLDRLTHLGWLDPGEWPAIALDPEEPAISLLAQIPTLDRDLTATERARFVLTPAS